MNFPFLHRRSLIRNTKKRGERREKRCCLLHTSPRCPSPVAGPKMEGKLRKERKGRRGEDTANKIWEVAGREFNPEWNDRDRETGKKRKDFFLGRYAAYLPCPFGFIVKYVYICSCCFFYLG